MFDTLAELHLTLLDWRPLPRNTLRGFATVRIGRELTMHGVGIHARDGVTWASLPVRAVLTPDGLVARDSGGKVRYAPALSWADRDAGDRFSEALIAAILADYGPDALDLEE